MNFSAQKDVKSKIWRIWPMASLMVTKATFAGNLHGYAPAMAYSHITFASNLWPTLADNHCMHLIPVLHVLKFCVSGVIRSVTSVARRTTFLFSSQGLEQNCANHRAPSIPLFPNQITNLCKWAFDFLLLESSSSLAYWLASLPSNHRLSLLCVQVPQVTILRTCPNMTLAVKWDVKPQLWLCPTTIAYF